MLQGITVIVHLTGLLLMTPDSAVGPDRDQAKLPVHLLMPVVHAPLEQHFAQIGTLPQDGKCTPPFALVSVEDQDDMCWVSLDGWSVEIGRPGPSSSNDKLLPEHAPMLGGGAQGHPVGRHLFGRMPGRELNSRVTLNAGRITDECPFATWTFPPNSAKTPITSVVDWSFTSDSASMEFLTATLLNDRSNSTPAIVLKLPPPEGERLDLFVRYVTRKDQDGIMTYGTPRRTRGTHLLSFYRLLGFGAEDRRPIPVFQDLGDHCTYGLMATPNSPTCMMGKALP